MEWLWAAAPAFACGAMMLVMFVPMFKNRKNTDAPETASKEDVAALREEISRLREARALDERESLRG